MHQHPCPSRHKRRFGIHAPRAERVSDGRGKNSPLSQLALQQLGVSIDDFPTPLCRSAARLKQRFASDLQAIDDCLKRHERIRTVGDSLTEDIVLHLSDRAEEHFALVGEVIEERSLRQACTRDDFGDSRTLETLFGEQLKGRRLQTFGSIGFPSGHLKSLPTNKWLPALRHQVHDPAASCAADSPKVHIPGAAVIACLGLGVSEP